MGGGRRPAQECGRHAGTPELPPPGRPRRGGEEWQRVEVAHALDRHAVVAEHEAVDYWPLEGAAADRGAEPELDEDDVPGAAPAVDLRAEVGEPGEDAAELPADVVEAAHRRRERLDERHVRGEERREAVE